ncbi:hypothetical protein [Epilithonimonas arachidiradicis]|uniref:Uncharacterized protein n=1 Tax=Epilithonimonas arachidiradicis TaxID=1617282 RepID=A0A420CPV6_9FLAO|nr:hypothetical protein [Epilithonimonas arachidiradicis]RKE80435.1 hypothetical protein BXY58_2960 [Epilithonimonas arachidiradicis]GGG63780.1 hypothetical protein GCM10007332_27490 [Epilithonimonas arachidiradicis]
MHRYLSKISTFVILTNLIIGNLVLFIGGKSSFTGNINYPLMAGMSIACIIFYILFFRLANYIRYSSVKLLLVCIISCMIIIFAGNFIGLLITERMNGTSSNFGPAIFMGIVGNILMLPVSLLLGVINFGIIKYFTRNKAKNQR